MEIEAVVPYFLQLPYHLASNSLALCLSLSLSLSRSFFLSGRLCECAVSKVLIITHTHTHILKDDWMHWMQWLCWKFCGLSVSTSFWVQSSCDGRDRRWELGKTIGCEKGNSIAKGKLFFRFGYPKTNGHSQYHQNLSSQPYQSFLLAKQNDDTCVAEIFVGENILTILVVKLLLLRILLVAFWWWQFCWWQVVTSCWTKEKEQGKKRGKRMRRRDAEEK